MAPDGWRVSGVAAGVYDGSVIRGALALAVLLAACKSSAPYTVPAAVLNTGIALGSAAGQRAAGGCWAVCTHGTVCNERTGLCEAAGPDRYCQEAPGGGVRCIPLEIGKEEDRKGAASPVGISPATGSVPPPPSESSPRGAP